MFLTEKIFNLPVNGTLFSWIANKQHVVHSFNRRYFKNRLFVSTWDEFDKNAANDYFEMHEALREMNN